MIRDAGTSPFTRIGQVSRSQGLKGELKVLFESNSPESVLDIKMVYLRNDRGDFYPCRIASLRTEGKGHRISFFVQFEHIADRNAAEALRGRGLYLEADKAELLFVQEDAEEGFFDFEVIDEDGNHIGLVTDELDTGAQLVLSVSTTKGTLLIPVVDQFVESIDESEKRIKCCNLDLLEDDE